MMHWIVTVIIGFIAGSIAKFFMKGSGPSGFLFTAVLGIAGSVLMSFVGQSTGWYKDGEIAGWIASVVGAMVLLFVYGLVTKKK
jgi:uncharacterized membrane protein YeaQ/YmgE (transglycosylase-associated protein family)